MSVCLCFGKTNMNEEKILKVKVCMALILEVYNQSTYFIWNFGYMNWLASWGKDDIFFRMLGQSSISGQV